MSLIRKQLEADRATAGTPQRPSKEAPEAETGAIWHTDAELSKIVEEAQRDKLVNELLMTKKVCDILEEKFGCEHPLKAILQIKRKIKAFRTKDITAAKIRQWGR